MTTLPAPNDKRWLLKVLFAHKERTIPAAMLMSVGFVCNATTPVIVGHAIDDAIARSSLAHLGLWIGILAATFLLNALCGWYSRHLFIRSRVDVAHALRMAVTDRIQDPRGMAGRPRTAGELLAVASTDVQHVSLAVMMMVFPVAEISSILYVAVMLSIVYLPLGLAVFVGGPLVVYISLLVARPLRRRSSARQQALAQAAATATDVVQGLRILKGLGAIGSVRARYAQVSTEAYSRTVAANGAQARLSATTETIGALYVSAVGLAAGYLAVHGVVSIGDLITVVGLTQFVIQPMTMMGKNLASTLANAQASAGRIRGLLTAGPATHILARLPELPVGITTISGHAPEGIEFIDRRVAVVAPHQADLFEGSVLDNISQDKDRGLKALHAAAGEDIPGGPERSVGENGGALSGGQRQRVALARALATDAPVLILQDPTTAVDSVTEQTIVSRVAKYRAGKRTLVYTSSPAWVAASRQRGQSDNHTDQESDPQ